MFLKRDGIERERREDAAGAGDGGSARHHTHPHRQAVHTALLRIQIFKMLSRIRSFIFFFISSSFSLDKWQKNMDPNRPKIRGAERIRSKRFRW